MPESPAGVGSTAAGGMLHKMAKKPTTQREMIDQLWYAMIGTNGNGVQARVEQIERVLPDLVTKRQCAATHQVDSNRRRSRWLAAKDIVLIVIGLAGAAKTVGLF